MIYDESTKVARKRVKNGVRWLDENFPGWEGRIDVDTLRLDDGVSCICGQVFRDKVDTDIFNGYGYAEGHLFAQANSWISALIGVEAIPRETIDEANAALNTSELDDDAYSDYVELLDAAQARATAVGVALGFMSDSEASFEALQEAWIRKLAKRAKKAVSV